MCSRPEIFEQNADRCRSRAERSESKEHRALYLDLAYQWLEMAAMIRTLEILELNYRKANAPQRVGLMHVQLDKSP